MEVKEQGELASTQYSNPEASAAPYPQSHILASGGDVVFCGMDLVYRSGFNSSGQIRFTALTRFHRMFAGEFVPGTMVYHVSKTHTRVRPDWVGAYPF